MDKKKSSNVNREMVFVVITLLLLCASIMIYLGVSGKFNDSNTENPENLNSSPFDIIEDDLLKTDIKDSIEDIGVKLSDVDSLVLDRDYSQSIRYKCALNVGSVYIYINDNSTVAKIDLGDFNLYKRGISSIHIDNFLTSFSTKDSLIQKTEYLVRNTLTNPHSAKFPIMDWTVCRQFNLYSVRSTVTFKNDFNVTKSASIFAVYDIDNCIYLSVGSYVYIDNKVGDFEDRPIRKIVVPKNNGRPIFDNVDGIQIYYCEAGKYGVLDYDHFTYKIPVGIYNVVCKSSKAILSIEGSQNNIYDIEKNKNVEVKIYSDSQILVSDNSRVYFQLLNGKHSSVYDFDKIEHWQKCEVCGKVLSRKEEHVFDNSTRLCKCGKLMPNADNLVYQQINDNEYAVSGYDGNSNDIVIPSIHNGKKVVKIFANSFSNNNDITSIHIPSSIEIIEEGSFIGCSNLRSFISDSSNFIYKNGCLIDVAQKSILTALKDSILPTDLQINIIAKKAFSNNLEINELILDNNITSINEYAFENCTSLNSLTIKNDKINIELDAFKNCLITTLDVPAKAIDCIDLSNAKSIVINSGGEAPHLKGLSKLEYVTFLDGNIKLSMYAINNCTNLKQVVFPFGIEYIPQHAVYNCMKIEKVILPVGIKKVYSQAFTNNNAALIVYCEESKAPNKWVEGWNNDIMVSWGYNNIISNPLYDYVLRENKIILTKYKGELDEVIIPSTIDGKDILYGSTFQDLKLDHVVISKNIIDIPSYTFFNCKINSLEFENNSKLLSVGDYSFAQTGIKYVILPNSLNCIGEYAFAFNNISTVIIPSSVQVIKKCAFAYYNDYACNVADLYYCGGIIPNSFEDDWDFLHHVQYNGTTHYQSVHLFSENRPTLESNKYTFWHYDIDGRTPILWKK